MLFASAPGKVPGLVTVNTCLVTPQDLVKKLASAAVTLLLSGRPELSASLLSAIAVGFIFFGRHFRYNCGLSFQ